MALEHILAAISDEARRDRARLKADARKEQALLVSEARARAAAVEAEIAASRDAELGATTERLESAARLDATRRLREGRERVFQEALSELERRLSLLRSDPIAYRRLFRALFEEARARLPEVDTICVDPRDAPLAAELGLAIEPSLESAGGLVLKGPRSAIDNTLEARLASAMPHLRRLAFEGSQP